MIAQNDLKESFIWRNKILFPVLIFPGWPDPRLQWGSSKTNHELHQKRFYDFRVKSFQQTGKPTNLKFQAFSSCTESMLSLKKLPWRWGAHHLRKCALVIRSNSRLCLLIGESGKKRVEVQEGYVGLIYRTKQYQHFEIPFVILKDFVCSPVNIKSLQYAVLKAAQQGLRTPRQQKQIQISTVSPCFANSRLKSFSFSSKKRHQHPQMWTRTLKMQSKCQNSHKESGMQLEKKWMNFGIYLSICDITCRVTGKNM